MRKNGFTLIELMIGLLLSSLLMLTMLTLFKQISFIGLNSSEDAEYEAQLEIGMLTIQKLVQNAGYGSGQNDDVIMGTYDSKDALLWRFAKNHEAVPIEFQCRGFSVDIGPKTANDKYVHRLLLLKAPCVAGDLVNDWTVEQAIAAVKSDQNTDPVFQFELVSGECAPFGIDQGGFVGDMSVAISGIRKYDYGVGNKEKFVCLSNIKQP